MDKKRRKQREDYGVGRVGAHRAMQTKRGREETEREREVGRRAERYSQKGAWRRKRASGPDGEQKDNVERRRKGPRDRQ